MLASSRFQWEEGWRRLEGERAFDSLRHRQLTDLVAVVGAGLRRRLGQTFTLDELDVAYARAEDWVALEVADALPGAQARVSIADTALVLDAAFRSFSRAAVDYTP